MGNKQPSKEVLWETVVEKSLHHSTNEVEIAIYHEIEDGKLQPNWQAVRNRAQEMLGEVEDNNQKLAEAMFAIYEMEGKKRRGLSMNMMKKKGPGEIDMAQTCALVRDGLNAMSQLGPTLILSAAHEKLKSSLDMLKQRSQALEGSPKYFKFGAEEYKRFSIEGERIITTAVAEVKTLVENRKHSIPLLADAVRSTLAPACNGRKVNREDFIENFEQAVCETVVDLRAMLDSIVEPRLLMLIARATFGQKESKGGTRVVQSQMHKTDEDKTTSSQSNHTSASCLSPSTSSRSSFTNTTTEVTKTSPRTEKKPP